MDVDSSSTDHVDSNNDEQQIESSKLQQQVSSNGGPRLAPNYSVVNAILEKK